MAEPKNTYSPKHIESEYLPNYSTGNNFNFDVLSDDKDGKQDEGIYGGPFMWNFEDYFSL